MDVEWVESSGESLKCYEQFIIKVLSLLKVSSEVSIRKYPSLTRYFRAFLARNSRYLFGSALFGLGFKFQILLKLILEGC